MPRLYGDPYKKGLSDLFHGDIPFKVYIVLFWDDWIDDAKVSNMQVGL